MDASFSSCRSCSSIPPWSSTHLIVWTFSFLGNTHHFVGSLPSYVPRRRKSSKMTFHNGHNGLAVHHCAFSCEPLNISSNRASFCKHDSEQMTSAGHVLLLSSL